MTDNPKQSGPRVPTAHPFTAIRMTLESSQSFDETHNKILAALNCTNYVPGEFMREAGPVVMQKDWGAFEEFLNGKAGPSGNILFDILAHSRWLTTYNPSSPHIATYVLGSPLKARPLLERFPDVGIHMPLRLNLRSISPASANLDGCIVSWNLPSSVISIGTLEESEEKVLKEIATVLDAEIEQLVREVTGN